MYRQLEHRLGQHIREFVHRQYGLDLEKIVIEQPPRVELGEYAMPLAFELAKKLRKAPRKIAEEIVSDIGSIDGFAKLEVAGAGYINARVDRTALAVALAKNDKPAVESSSGKVLVEHVMMVKKHVRPNPQRNIKGGIAEQESRIALSNVQLVCPTCGPVRIGHEVRGERKVRICKKCGMTLDK